jgi:hypothetical protein
MVVSDSELKLHVNYLAGFYGASGVPEPRKDRTVRGDLVAGNMNHDGSHAEFGKVMLAFQFAVDCDKDVVRFRCVGDQQTVFGSAPANLAHSSDQVALTLKCIFHAGIDAFI